MSATNRGAERSYLDYYATPPSALEALVRTGLFEVLRPKVQHILEPCHGKKRAIVSLLKEQFPDASIESLDLDSETEEDRHDYLTYLPRQVPDLLVTNPPFTIAQDFLEKSLREATTVVYLLRLNFLGSRKRASFWKEHPPKALYVLSSRPSFTGKGTDATEYAWFVWSKDPDVPAGIFVV